MPKQVTIWVTKYALTRGIYPVLAKDSDHNTGVMTIGDGSMGSDNQMFFVGDYELTKEAADKKAIKLAMKKIKLLEKQHAALCNLVLELGGDLTQGEV